MLIDSKYLQFVLQNLKPESLKFYLLKVKNNKPVGYEDWLFCIGFDMNSLKRSFDLLFGAT